MAITLPLDPDLARLVAAPRPAPGLAAGVTEDMIRQVVDAFYGKIRDDAVLGPIFHERIGEWDLHLRKMYDFWSSVLLMSGRFKGSPMRAHASMADVLGADHFTRWLELFEETTREGCPPDAAALFLAKARVIAASLQAGMAFVSGDSLTAS